MVRNKEGLAKENMCKEWCRRVYMHAEARGCDTDDCYKSLALDVLSNDLTPKQRLDPKYEIQRDRVSGKEIIIQKQRSWINHMLRMNLGDYRVEYTSTLGTRNSSGCHDSCPSPPHFSRQIAVRPAG